MLSFIFHNNYNIKIYLDKQQGKREMYQGAISQGQPSTERRSTHRERRWNHSKAAVHSFYRKRRKHIRREDDYSVGTYVDTHEPRLFYLAMSLMALSVMDAFFTTLLLSNGSEELNPILAYLLGLDMYVFLGAKFLITGSCAVFFIMHKHHRLFNVVSCYQLLVLSVAIYFLLVCYELSMVRHLPII